MTANIAAVQLLLDDGTDLADRINPRLIELTLSERREAEADELTIRLDNSNGTLALPTTGQTLTLALGWRQGRDVPVGMVGKGRFVVDGISASGPPDEISLRARSADLTGLYQQRRTRSWTDTTLGAVLVQIAGEHGATARVVDALAARSIMAIEQEGKSDMAFVRDLGRRYDAVATWKGGVLLFLPVGASASASGQALDRITLTKGDAGRWEFSQLDREAQDGAEAQWHDAAAGRRRTVQLGGENRRKLERVYATEAEARQAAQAALARAGRAAYRFTYELAVADPARQTDQRVTLQGWGQLIDGLDWLVESVETTLGPNGLAQRIEMEGVA